MEKSNAKRYGIHNTNIGNTIIKRMLYIDTADLQTHKIYEAAHATKYIFKTISKINRRYMTKLIIDSCKIFLLKKKEAGSFPNLKL